MKIIKYIIFLSVLGGIFLIVYRNSDSKGLRRWWASLKMATSIAAILAGLIPSPVEAIEPHVSNDSPPMERIVKLSGGDQSKFGPGARAKAAARRNAQSSGSFLIPGANGFVPQRTYCRYHENAPLSYKPRVKVSDSPFQGDGNNPPPEDCSEFDFSQYKGGPSPFKNFDYDNENYTRENVVFSSQRRMNHSYDGHAEKCFGMQENRNKQSLQKFEKNIRDYVESAETERINGSYRYETPAYHYKKPDEDLIITVNATNNEYISVRNATDFQLEKLEIDGNLGYDSRPSMSLKLRGPKQ